MPTPDITAGTVMESAAALLNDTARQVYTDSKVLPYLKIALKDLREIFELNDIPVTLEKSSTITVTAGITIIGFATTPALPSDLVEIKQLWEANSGTGNFVPVTKKDFIPNSIVTPVNNFGVWAWRSNAINVPASVNDVDLKIDYIKQLFTNVVDENSNINVIDGESFLHYRTAALCAFYIGENKTRSDELNQEAGGALDRALGIETKPNQAISTRRLPFRFSFKHRGFGR